MNHFQESAFGTQKYIIKNKRVRSYTTMVKLFENGVM